MAYLNALRAAGSVRQRGRLEHPDRVDALLDGGRKALAERSFDTAQAYAGAAGRLGTQHG